MTRFVTLTVHLVCRHVTVGPSAVGSRVAKQLLFDASTGVSASRIDFVSDAAGLFEDGGHDGQIAGEVAVWRTAFQTQPKVHFAVDGFDVETGAFATVASGKK